MTRALRPDQEALLRRYLEELSPELRAGVEVVAGALLAADQPAPVPRLEMAARVFDPDAGHITCLRFAAAVLGRWNQLIVEHATSRRKLN